MKLFLRDLRDSGTPRHTRDEERELARVMRLGQDAEKQIRQAKTDRERNYLQRRLAGQIQAGQDARDRLAASVFPLAVRYATKFGRLTTGIDTEDLVQEAIGGVFDALEPGKRSDRRFDPEQGKFTTYVTWWIRQRLLRYIGSNRFTVRLPAYVAWNRTQCNNREAWESAERVKAGVLPLDAVSDQSGGTGLNLLEAPDAFSDMIEEEDKQHHVRILRSLVRRLPDREKFVLYSRINGDTLDEVGACLCVTRERVRQIEASAICRVRNWYEKRSKRIGRRSCRRSERSEAATAITA
jgi:RNA polymerase sigma factor (sigma-70 family)